MLFQCVSITIFSVWFGKSTGKRTERGIKDDLQRVYDLIKSKVDQKHIIVYGRSMGSGFATKLASTNNPKMLILESPYYSMMKMASRYLPLLPTMVIRFKIRSILSPSFDGSRISFQIKHHSSWLLKAKMHTIYVHSVTQV